MAAMGSVLTNKYAEGHPGKRHTAAANASMRKTSPSTACASCSARNCRKTCSRTGRAGEHGGLSGAVQAG